MSLRHQSQKRAAAPASQPQADSFVFITSDTSSPTPSQPPTASISTAPQAVPTTQSDPDSGADKDLVNMYFLILAAFVVIMIAGIWYWRRGRKRKQLESVGRRQNALEQDLELGRQRGVRGSNRTGPAGWLGLSRREREGGGLDEREEAPPPYTPNTPNTLLAAGQVVVPARVHVREGSAALPKYEELGEIPGRAPEGEFLEAEPTQAAEPIPARAQSEGAGRPSTSGIIRSRDVAD